MANVTLKGQKNGYVHIRADSTGFTNIGLANNVGETVTSMTVAQAAWTCGSAATWTIARGGTTVAVLTGPNGTLDFQGSALPLELTDAEKQANVVFTLSGGTGTLLLKLHKRSN